MRFKCVNDRKRSCSGETYNKIDGLTQEKIYFGLFQGDARWTNKGLCIFNDDQVWKIYNLDRFQPIMGE